MDPNIQGLKWVQVSVLCTLPYAFLGVCFCFLVWGSNLKSLTFQARALPAALPFRLCKGTGSWEVLVPDRAKAEEPLLSPDPGPHCHPEGSFKNPQAPNHRPLTVWRGPHSKASPPGSQASLRCHCFSISPFPVVASPVLGLLKEPAPKLHLEVQEQSSSFVLLLWFSVVSRARTTSQPSLSHRQIH